MYIIMKWHRNYQKIDIIFYKIEDSKYECCCIIYFNKQVGGKEIKCEAYRSLTVRFYLYVVKITLKSHF